MASDHITIKATTAVWLYQGSKPHQLVAHIEKGNHRAALDMLHLYGPASMDKFGDYVRVGEADVTVRLIPRDDQVRMAVDSLKEQLEQARAAFHAKQQEILDEINKLQAITFDAGAA